MKILISGSTGLVGSKLVPLLTAGGHDVARLVRTAKTKDGRQISWDPAAGTIDGGSIQGFDAVVHLAGENIAAGRWNAARKARIRDSRVNGTRLLCETLASLENPPKTLVSASAIGFYGDRGDEELDERSAAGTSFLANVCKEWEAAADSAREKGVRVISLRIGVVLSPEGGALQKMLTPFKLGAGGIVGNGWQYWSWIGIDDVVSVIQHALKSDELSGPVNCVAPNPSTNRQFTKTLGRVLSRPTIFPLPAFVAKLMLGGMADELLLASARVHPKRLQETGYEFRHPQLEAALRHLLGR